MKITRELCKILLIVALLAAQAVTARGERASPQPADPAGTVDGFIEQQMDEAGIMGLGAAILVDRKELSSK